MGRLLALLAALSALLVGDAAAKEFFDHVSVCGPERCIEIRDRSLASVLIPMPARTSAVSPSAPAPFYTVWFIDREGRRVHESPSAYYVPGAATIRTRGIARWYPVEIWNGRVRAALEPVRPFAAPTIARVEVDGRAAREPASYAVLFELGGTKAADPAGHEPFAQWSYESWAHYFARVRRHWLPVNLWSRASSPWGDGDNYVWISRKGDLLKRDGEVLHVPLRLADCVRRGLSLRLCA